MRIVEARIRNYGSLVDISFSGQPFMVFVGPNGQGKSLIFEALQRFFADFSSIGGAASTGLSDRLWFRRETKQPIQFEIELSLDDDEAHSLLPFGKEIFRLVAKNSSATTVHLKRSLSPEGAWLTEELSWMNIPIVAKNAITTPNDFLVLLDAK